jgi:hypothetical protein
MRYSKIGALGLAAVLGMVPMGSIAGEYDDELELIESASKGLADGALKLVDLVALHREGGRDAVAERLLEALDSVVDLLDETVDRLDGMGKALTKSAAEQAGAGRAEAAKTTLEEWQKVTNLKAKVKARLDALVRARRPFDPPAPSGKEGGSDKGLRDKWFGPRLKQSLGSSRSDEAVRLALDWLAKHQHASGYWDCDGFGAQCEGARCGGPGYALYDPGVSGLTLLAFLGAGNTHMKGDHKKTVLPGSSI